MPRRRKPSRASQWLVNELARRGCRVGHRSIEYWASLGLAPKPIRAWPGRGKGSTSRYPPAAVDQYVAVADVMRRGRPWQFAVLILFARGGMPTNETLLAHAVRDILMAFVSFVSALPGDPLARAEKAAQLMREQRGGTGITKFLQRNLRGVNLRNPYNPEEIHGVHETIDSVLTSTALIAQGEETVSLDALRELGAAFGLPIEELTDEYLEGMKEWLSSQTFAAQIQALENAPISALQAALAPSRELFDEKIRPQLRPTAATADIFVALMAMGIVQAQVEPPSPNDELVRSGR